MELLKRYESWRDNAAFDDVTRAELAALADNAAEIEERFHQNLEFGTGGLRGILGAGTNRMNTYTVRRASQGLANYILANTTDGAGRGVAVSHDSRRFSREFALETALIMVQNGIKAYVFADLRPTPQLSFAIRRLGCIAGVMITASHNPPEYNGYKAYWSDGAQFVSPQDQDVIACVNAIEDLAGLQVANMDEALQSGMLTIIDAAMDDEYLATVHAQSLAPDVITKMAQDFTIVYTPLNGAGGVLVPKALRQAGFTDIHLVAEQADPDPDFPTLAYPNPEDPAAFELGITLADKVNADIIVATDPDADRVGAMVRNAAGDFELLSGNAAGVILAEYILSKRQEKGCLPPNPAIISTIVSTRLTAEIAKAYGAAYADVLTGYKYIAEQMRLWEQEGLLNYVFGFEESYGYLAGNAVRDKDAVSATMLLCEAAACYKSHGMTLLDALDEIYHKYGYFVEINRSVTLKGLDGLAQIRAIMADLRENPPKQVGNTTIAEIRDYKTSTAHCNVTCAVSPIHLPVSDVLYYVLADGAWFCVRPSGTEPKIKVYLGVAADNAAGAKAKLNELAAAVYGLLGFE